MPAPPRAEVHAFLARTDNLGLLLRDPATGTVAVIDAPEEGPILRALADRDWRPSLVVITHKHPDHVEAVPALVRAFGCKVVAPAKSGVPGADRRVGDGDVVEVGSVRLRAIATPGHCDDHLAYAVEGEDGSPGGVAFCGDALFPLGCGRVLEGRPEVLHASLQRLKALPDDTTLYCGHDYTAANARFALSVEPGNAALQARAAEAEAMKARRETVLSTTLAAEKAANPFLRVGEPAVRLAVGLPQGSEAEVFVALRRAKDVFRG